MKAVIIEDEPLVAKDLRKLISTVDPQIEIIRVLDSVESTIEYFKDNEEPDLIFMDIQLSDGVSFDIYKSIKIKCPVIFTTAYNEYAIRAFKVNSVDYLLKPVDVNDLKQALEKLKNNVSGALLVEEQLLSLIANAGNKSGKIYKERFKAISGKSYVVISQDKISCFKKETLIYLVTSDNIPFITDFQSMDELEELLDPKKFFRANRQMIINIDAVESYRTDAYSKLIVTLKPPFKENVDISREKAQAFKAWLE
jgi:two-component system, LytTR family, response regulator